ncbi:MAG: oxidoreductase, partial [Pseudomonadota bacterium]
ETVQIYARNHYVGRLHKLGVEIRTHLRLFGVDEDTVYFQDTLTGDPVLMEETDTLVLSLGHVSVEEQHCAFFELAENVVPVGDCIAARSAEEAVYEGMMAGRNI